MPGQRLCRALPPHGAGRVLSLSLLHPFYKTVEALQADLDAWLVHYNTERPHHGYRNMGKRPIETILSYLESVRREAQ